MLLPVDDLDDRADDEGDEEVGAGKPTGSRAEAPSRQRVLADEELDESDEHDEDVDAPASSTRSTALTTRTAAGAGCADSGGANEMGAAVSTRRTATVDLD